MHGAMIKRSFKQNLLPEWNVSQLCIQNEEFTLKLYVKFVVNIGLELGKMCDACRFLLNG